MGYSQVHDLVFMVFFITENHVRPSGSYTMVCSYSKIPKYFTRGIRNDCFCFMPIPCWCNMDSVRSTNFPMNTPSDLIMPFSHSLWAILGYSLKMWLIVSFPLFLWFVNLTFNYISWNGLFLGSKYQAFHVLGSNFTSISTYPDSLLP